ncbi:MAG: glycosyltransferase [Verrucomicrobiales bacterium]
MTGPEEIPFLRRTVVVMPALDEEDSVADALRHWKDDWKLPVVRVIDNGSVDQTAERARAAGAEVIREPRRGYGAAAWTGVQDLPANAQWILFASADGSDYLDPRSAAAFQAAVDSGAGLVVGNRLARPQSRRHLSPVQRFGNGLCCFLIRWGWGTRFRDMGSLRLIHRDVLKMLELQDRAFGWNIEMQIRAIECGVCAHEVPVGYRPRTAGEGKISGNVAGVARAGRDILLMLGTFYLRRWRSPRAAAQLKATNSVERIAARRHSAH